MNSRISKMPTTIHLKRKNIKTVFVSVLLMIIVIALIYPSSDNTPLTGSKLPRDVLIIRANQNQPRHMNLDSGIDKNYFDIGAHSIDKNTCKERKNFVFIKTMKCATETVVRILRRFGYTRHLNFVLPRKNNIYLGWPFIMRPIDYRMSSKPFNILTEHAVYNKTVMRDLMPQDTVYLTIIREPFSQFKSSFHYFNVANITGIKAADHITEYLHNIDKYETFYKSPEGSKIRYCIPDGFSVTKNLLSHCLGMPLGFPPGRENLETRDTAVEEYIDGLDKDFTLVMIMEYFHESLVLMKRLMCWSLQDILYRTENVGTYSYKTKQPNGDNLAIHKKWSSVDYKLYDHFNKTFWEKIELQGSGFFEEVALYSNIQRQVSEYCSSLHPGVDNLTIPASIFDNSFVISPDFCLAQGLELLTFLKNRFDTEEEWTEPANERNLPKKTC